MAAGAVRRGCARSLARVTAAAADEARRTIVMTRYVTIKRTAGASQSAAWSEVYYLFRFFYFLAHKKALFVLATKSSGI